MVSSSFKNSFSSSTTDIIRFKIPAFISFVLAGASVIVSFSVLIVSITVGSSIFIVVCNSLSSV
jgi:hypothetical protein